MKMLNCPHGSNMKSFGRHKDQPQAATSTLVLIFMISLLKPSSASATRVGNTSFDFPSSGSESLKLLDIQGNASVLSPNLHLSRSQPNQNPSGDCGQATYSRDVHLWDKATGNAKDHHIVHSWEFSPRLQVLAKEVEEEGNRPYWSNECLLVVTGGVLVSLVISIASFAWVRYRSKGNRPYRSNDLPGGNDEPETTEENKSRPREVDEAGNRPYRSNDLPGGNDEPMTIEENKSRPREVDEAWRNDLPGGNNELKTTEENKSRPREVDEGWRNDLPGGNNEPKTTEENKSRPREVEEAGNRPYRSNYLPRGNDEPETTEENKSRPREVGEAGHCPCRSNDLLGGNNEPKTTEENKSRPREVEVEVEEAGNRSMKLTQELEQFSGPKKFSFEELTAATDSFAHDRILGKGGFGTVYEGQIGDARTVVAVKVMNSDSGQGIQEYVSEVRSISQLRHRNLVQLIGYCHEANNFALVYEFMKHGSLDDHLFRGRTVLTWERRYDIALGLASGLHYLHKECKQCVIHRDIKSSNTMLDERFEAKLGDFGLARLVDHARGRKTTEMIGTWGYAAPEYCETGKASKESDVYSFGVVLLEIVCGRSAVESARADQVQNALVKWVWEQYGCRKLLDAVDSRLGMNFDRKQAKALMVAGLWCAHPTVSSRPSIEAAMAVLNLKARRPNLPSIMPRSNHVTDPKVSARCFCL